MSPRVLHPLSTGLDTCHPVRKSASQKAAFRDALVPALREMGWPVVVQSTRGLVKSHNVVVGNPQTAKLVLSAHYDTPARLPFPNFIIPKNILLTLASQAWLVVALVAASIATARLVMLATATFWLAQACSIGILLLCLFLMLVGPANPTNRNDNTSGILTLVEIAAALPPALRDRVALVFFDNEELGLLGSAAFRKQYGPLPGAPLLNLDCVGDGDTLLFVGGGVLRRDAALKTALAECFATHGGKKTEITTSPLAYYPSDQIGFRRGIGVAAMHRKPLIGLCLGRIHTRRDTRLDTENLLLLRDGALRLAQRL